MNYFILKYLFEKSVYKNVTHRSFHFGTGISTVKMVAKFLNYFPFSMTLRRQEAKLNVTDVTLNDSTLLDVTCDVTSDGNTSVIIGKSYETVLPNGFF